jgi:hypothetical protein
VTFAERDALEVDALQTDRYLEALLAAGDRAASDAPSDASLDSNVRVAAARLRRDLGRVHPSFRFEERLAARLAELAAAMRVGAAAGAEGMVIPFGGPPGLEDPAGDDADHAEGPEGGPGLHRPFLIGGAMASAALSIAGAAYIAWRRSRTPISPMAWAVRAARQRKLD